MNTLFFIGMPGGFEWIIIVLIVLLLFGAKRIPELARGLGQGINEFRKASNDIKREIERGEEEEAEKTAQSRKEESKASTKEKETN